MMMPMLLVFVMVAAVHVVTVAFLLALASMQAAFLPLAFATPVAIMVDGHSQTAANHQQAKEQDQTKSAHTELLCRIGCFSDRLRPQYVPELMRLQRNY
jgi:hypothetical protein